MFGSLNSISNLASGDLCKDNPLVYGRKLGRSASRRALVIRKEVLKCPRDSRLANTKFGGNMASGDAIRGQGKNILFLSRGDGVHWKL